MTDDKLIVQIKEYVKNERVLLKQILLSLKEIERRRLFLKRGYSSLFVFCTRGLGYSESAAQRRIEAMRAIKELPEIAEKIEIGKLTLSSVALAQRAIRHEQKRNSSIIQTEKRKEIFESLENKSRREAELILVSEFPESAQALKPDRTKPITKSKTEINFIADESLMEKLETIRQKFSHKNVSPSYNDLFQMMADQILKKPSKRATQSNSLSGDKRKSRSGNQTTNTALSRQREIVSSVRRKAPSPRESTASRLRYIPAAIKRELYRRDRGECQYVDLQTNNRCLSRHLVQVDHKVPVSRGGCSTLDNLQLLCAAHNQLKSDSVELAK